MLLVIFGAGASHDSVRGSSPLFSSGEALEYQPPLTATLFSSVDAPYAAALDRYGLAQGIAGKVDLAIQGGAQVEQALERQAFLATNDLMARRELIAVQYYLRDVIEACGGTWHQKAHGSTNYAILLSYLDAWRAQLKEREPIMLLTFNYDDMLERALVARGHPGFGVMDEYVAREDYVVIKVHGSVTWSRLTRDEFVGGPNEAIRLAPEPSEDYRPGFGNLSENNRLGLPAIAIPTQGKSQFVCPDRHIDAMRSFFPGVDRLLIIGWAMNDKLFKDFALDAGLNPKQTFVADIDADLGIDNAKGFLGEHSGVVSGFGEVDEAVIPKADPRNRRGFTGMLTDGTGLERFLDADLRLMPLDSGWSKGTPKQR